MLSEGAFFSFQIISSSRMLTCHQSHEAVQCWARPAPGPGHQIICKDWAEIFSESEQTWRTANSVRKTRGLDQYAICIFEI